MGSTVAPRLLVACALSFAMGAPLAAQRRGVSAGDTLKVGPAISVDVRLGGAGEAFDPSAPRPVRRREASAPRAVLPAAVLHRAPFPTAAVGPEGIGLEVAGAVVLGGATVPVAGEGALPDAGTRLQLWRPGEDGDGGAVGWPVAAATMTSGPALRVDHLYGRVQPGDRIRVLPSEPDLAGRRLEPVAAGRRAEVVDLLPRRPLTQPGDWVRLAVGEEAGIRSGDEFVPVAGSADLHSETRLQIVSVHSGQSVARILKLGSTSLMPGTTVRLDRRVR